MIISISGPPGSGKSTVAEMLAKKLGMKRYYVGGIRRELARKKGMTIDEYNKLGEKDPSTDKEVDEWQKKLGEKEDNFIIEGRTSYYFIPHSIKIYLDVNEEEGAKRIYESKASKERNEKKYSDIEETKKAIKERMKSDEKRYKQYYGINCYDKKNYDIIIDTTNMTPEEVTEKIIKEINKQKNQ